MELRRKNIATPDDTGKPVRVLTFRQRQRCISRGKVVAVDKIEAFAIFYPGKQRMGRSLVNTVPAHVRHFEALASGICQVSRKTDHIARKQAKSGGIAFFTVLENQLRTDANTKIGDMATARALGDRNGEMPHHNIINAGNQLFDAGAIG